METDKCESATINLAFELTINTPTLISDNPGFSNHCNLSDDEVSCQHMYGVNQQPQSMSDDIIQLYNKMIEGTGHGLQYMPKTKPCL